MHFQASPWIKPSAPSQPDQSQRGGSDDDDSLFGIFFGLVSALWRWRLLILAFLAAGLLAAWLILLTMPSTFVARAEVYFDFSRQTAISDLPAATVAPSEAMLNTEMELLISRNQMKLVVEEFNLTEDPEFNPWLIDEDGVEADTSALPSIDTDIIPLTDADGQLLTDADALPSEERVQTTAVSILLGKVDVQLVPNSYVFSITVETLAPEKSAAIANGVAELFIAARNQRRINASDDAISWLEDRTSNLRDRVREAETEVANLRALSSPGGDSDISATAARIAFMRERDATLQAQARRLSDLADRLGDMSAPSGLDADIRADLAEFAADLLPRLEAAAAEGDTELFGDLVEQARERLVSSATEVRQEAARLRTELDGLLEVYDERTAEEQSLRDAQRESAASLAAYEALLGRLKGRTAVGALDPFWPEATVISPAVPPAFPAFPDRELILALGGLGGLALASGLALLLSALFPVLSSPRGVAQATGMPVLVKIPLPRGARLSKLQRYLERRRRARSPSRRGSPLADGLRALQIAVVLESRGPRPHIVLLTSADRCDGKGVIGHLLAQSFVRGGRKVLLIDADPETVAHSGQTASGLGLGDILFGKADLAEAITQDPSSGADVLVAPHALLDDADMFAHGPEERNSLEKMAAQYDLVVLVAPPVTSFPDARIFALLADCVLVFIRKNATRPAAVSSAVNMLINAGASRIATAWLSRSGR